MKLLSLLLLLALPVMAQAQFTFTTNSGAITITGYTGPGGVVIIPATTNGYPVTSIGAGAFVHCLSLMRVTIPNSVTNIGGYAFQSCYSLTNITVVAGNPDYSSVNGVLFDQAQATLIAYPGGLDGGYTIPNSVTSIGGGAFFDCLSLTSVTIPNSVTSGDYAFSGCFSLTNINVVAGNPDYSSVNGVLFDQAQATLIECPEGLRGGYTIPNSVTSIGVEAFENSRLTSVAIPNTVISIGEGAFSDCTNLTSVTIPNSVTNIGDYAFLTCSNLTSAYFLGNAPPDDGTVFQYCNNATVYYLAGTTGWGSTFGGVPAVSLTPQAQFTFTTNSGAITITGYTGSGGAVLIPVAINGYPVTSIGEGAFVGSSLTSVTIPNSVTNIGVEAFEDCFSLTNITVVAGDPDYSSVNGVLFDRTQAILIEYPGGLGGDYTIPNSVTTIGDGAFIDCLGLTSVTIPNSVISGDYAFFGCFNLMNINVVAGNPDYSSINGVLFDRAQATLIEYPEGLRGGYTIPNSVTSIGVEAFGECESLTSVTIPNSVTRIGSGAFFDCFSLTSVTIPNRVTSIGDYAFLDCTNLTSAYFLGNAPPDDGTVFNDDPATVYYLAGTTGWGPTFGGVPAVSLTLQAQVPGVTAGQFGFSITGPPNTAIVVEACTNLVNPVWLPIATNTLSGTGTGTFSDPQTGSYPARYYRFSAP